MARRILLALVAVLLVTCPIMSDWVPEDGHKMHFPQLPDEEGWNVNASEGRLLADDWQCSETGPVDEIHFWGSWFEGTVGTIGSFNITIYSDIPDPDPQDPATHSMPGDPLWVRTIPYELVVAQHITPDPQLWEGWYDPYTDLEIYPDHDNYFQYNIEGIEDAFIQQEGTIYWLAISANIISVDPPPLWGWKSSVEHWNDDAVFGEPTCAIPDDGTGTVALPADCPYTTPEDNPMMIIDGLPPGTTIEMDARLTNFQCDQPTLCSQFLPPGVCEDVGGSLGGNFHCFSADLNLVLTGTGDLTGYSRTLQVPVEIEIHTGPRTSGDPIQEFPGDMVRLQGEIIGDPDFCVFRIIAGTDYGLPCPGEFSLALHDPDWWVESFFDVTYQIEFEGCPGSPLDGYMGTTTATTVWTQGGTTWSELFEPDNAETLVNAFWITMDPTGMFLGGGGEGAFGDGWYFYPEDEWWNIWFYDHPYDDTRMKVVHVEVDIFPFDLGGPRYIEFAVNWSTDLWSLEQPPGDSTPPLPGVPEELFIGRAIVFASDNFEGHYSFDYTIPDYNPEWVSIDVRGFNFDIPMGTIEHTCMRQVGTSQSMDLSFVINHRDLNCCVIRGDINHSGGAPDISDLVYLVTYMFSGGPPPPCMAEANINGSAGSDIPDISDLVYLVTYMFSGGPAPVPCPR